MEAGRVRALQERADLAPPVLRALPGPGGSGGEDQVVRRALRGGDLGGVADDPEQPGRDPGVGGRGGHRVEAAQHQHDVVVVAGPAGPRLGMVHGDPLTAPLQGRGQAPGEGVVAPAPAARGQRGRDVDRPAQRRPALDDAQRTTRTLEARRPPPLRLGGGPAPALLGGCSPGAGRRHDHPGVRHHVGGVPRPVGGAERHHAGTEVGHGQVRGAGGVGGCLAAQERGGQRARGDHGLVRLDQQRPDPAHGRVGEAVDEVVQPRPVGRFERGVGDHGDRAGHPVGRPDDAGAGERQRGDRRDPSVGVGARHHQQLEGGPGAHDLGAVEPAQPPADPPEAVGDGQHDGDVDRRRVGGGGGVAGR